MLAETLTKVTTIDALQKLACGVIEFDQPNFIGILEQISV